MVEIQHTPDRSSGQSFDTSGSFIVRIGPLIPGACAPTPAEVHTLGSLDGGPPGIDPIAVRGHNMPRATSLPLPQPPSQRRIIQEEREWRRPSFLPDTGRADLRLVATRWAGADLREKTSEITGDYHMLSISLKPTEFSIWLGTTSIPHKKLAPGMMQLTAPALPARIVYHAAYDVLHLFIPNSFLKEFSEWTYGRAPSGDIALRDPSYAHDPVIGGLAAALLAADELDGRHGALYAESLSLAIVARLFSRYAERHASTSHRDVAALPNWRLKRVVDFMDCNAEKQIKLADLARIAGLSRMHFAAQFRKATGQRPHEYLLRRRVEKAKVMLTTTSQPIAEVALTVGFNSQAHLTDMFKRFVGLTPHRWRECNRG